VFPGLLLQSGQQLNSFVGFVPLILIFAIFYFLLFLPMQRQKKAQQKMLADLASGQTVVTTGGIVGTIVSIHDELLVLRIKPDGVKLQVTRSAVSSLMSEESGK
jgi:preprotein translocase subunit YajC